MYTPKPLNAIQEQRAARHPADVSDAAFSTLHESMTLNGLKAAPVLTIRDKQSGAVTNTWQDRVTGKWIWQQTNADKSTQRLEANSPDELKDLVYRETGGAIDEEPIKQTQREQIVSEWADNTKWGREFERIASLLSDERAEEFAAVIEKYGRKLFGTTYWNSIERWDKAYVTALDNDALQEFEDEADSIEARKTLADQLGQIGIAKTAATSTVSLAEQVDQARAKRAAEDKTNRELAQTKEGLKELRRRALFETKGGRTPLTGTGRHLPL